MPPGLMMSSAPVMVEEMGNSRIETMRMVPPAKCLGRLREQAVAMGERPCVERACGGSCGRGGGTGPCAI